METIFRYEKKVAQLILVPSSPIEEAQLAIYRQYGEKGGRMKLGTGKEIIVEFGPNGGDSDKS